MFVLKYAIPSPSSPADVRDQEGANVMTPARQGRSEVQPPCAAMERQQPLSPTLSRPVTIPSRRSSRPTDSRRSSTRRPSNGPRRNSRQAEHDANALPPAVAALLAVTAIPLRKTVKRRSEQRRISIDELVQRWRDEAHSLPAYGSHKSLDMLLDVADDSLETSVSSLDACSPTDPEASRSASSDSVPSLDADDRSLLSLDDPPTPSVPREKRNSLAFRKCKPRATSVSAECSLDHPLVTKRPQSSHLIEDDAAIPSQSPISPASPASASSANTQKSSFKSNLTLSLQSLKNRALSSLSGFTLNAASDLQPSAPRIYEFSDEQLWSHPYIFPRLTTEVRPTFSGVPSESQRRYLNPSTHHSQSSTSSSSSSRSRSSSRQRGEHQQQSPLNLQEQQGDFRAALHSPERNMARGDMPPRNPRSPMIQMVTYNRSGSRSPSPSRRRRSSLPRIQTGPAAMAQPRHNPLLPPSRRGSEEGGGDAEGSATEAAAATLLAGRQREARENSAFLRVVVLEMNMRRAGKLESGVPGRARIWLPPRRTQSAPIVPVAASPQSPRSGGLGAGQGAAESCVPSRWTAITADDDDE